mgnify:FL=1
MSNVKIITQHLENKIKQLQSDKDKLIKDIRKLKNPVIKSQSEQEAELLAKVEWSNLFMTYIYEENKDLYNTAVEYADNNQFKT